MGFNIVDCKGVARPEHPRHTWLLLNLPQKSELAISTKNAKMLSKSSPHAITFAAARWKNLLYPDLLHNLSTRYHLQWPVQAHVNELIRYKYKRTRKSSWKHQQELAWLKQTLPRTKHILVPSSEGTCQGRHPHVFSACWENISLLINFFVSCEFEVKDNWASGTWDEWRWKSF